MIKNLSSLQSVLSTDNQLGRQCRQDVPRRRRFMISVLSWVLMWRDVVRYPRELCKEKIPSQPSHV